MNNFKQLDKIRSEFNDFTQVVSQEIGLTDDDLDNLGFVEVAKRIENATVCAIPVRCWRAGIPQHRQLKRQRLQWLIERVNESVHRAACRSVLRRAEASSQFEHSPHGSAEERQVRLLQFEVLHGESLRKRKDHLADWQISRLERQLNPVIAGN